MRKMLMLLAVLAMSVAGCATMSAAEKSFHAEASEDVYLNPFHSWSNSYRHEGINTVTFGKVNTPLRSITAQVFNNRYRSVEVTVTCSFPKGRLFGTRVVTVAARDSKVFTVRGLAPHVLEANTASCEITRLR